MRLEFEDHKIALVLDVERAHETRLSVALIRALRRQLQHIMSATDERDLRKIGSLRFEKLKGDRDGQHSIRLNKQWRLIMRLDKTTHPATVVVIEVVDYH